MLLNVVFPHFLAHVNSPREYFMKPSTLGEFLTSLCSRIFPWMYSTFGDGQLLPDARTHVSHRRSGAPVWQDVPDLMAPLSSAGFVAVRP